MTILGRTLHGLSTTVITTALTHKHAIPVVFYGAILVWSIPPAASTPSYGIYDTIRCPTTTMTGWTRKNDGWGGVKGGGGIMQRRESGHFVRT